MTPEQLVPNLETCKLLKDAGWEKDVYFYWYYTKFTPDKYGREWLGRYDDVQVQMVDDVFPAPTLQELLEELRSKDVVLTYSQHNQGAWHIEAGSIPFGDNEAMHSNPAEAAALLWLELHKEVAV